MESGIVKIEIATTAKFVTIMSVQPAHSSSLMMSHVQM